MFKIDDGLSSNPRALPLHQNARGELIFCRRSRKDLAAVVVTVYLASSMPWLRPNDLPERGLRGLIHVALCCAHRQYRKFFPQTRPLGRLDGSLPIVPSTLSILYSSNARTA
jgi:hypothetical protein